MAAIAKTPVLLGLPPLDQLQRHPLWPLWMAPGTGLLARLQQAWEGAQVHPSRCVVLLPYAQLRALAQRLWQHAHPQGFMPRFESTLSWAASLGGSAGAAPQWQAQVALDWWSAQHLLAQVGQGPRAQALAPALLEAAQQLVAVVRAQPPAQRAAWVAQTRTALGPLDAAGVGAWEMLVTHVALEWLGSGSFATDVLFGAAPWQQADLVLQLDGLEADPLAQSLQAHWGGQCWQRVGAPGCVLSPGGSAREQGQGQGQERRSSAAAFWDAGVLQAPAASGWLAHRCASAFDEAQRAAACAVRHVQAGRYPLALVCSDRALARQVRAQLDAAGVAVRDETGWKLSTRAAAAALVALLRACAPDASSDAVLQWLGGCAWGAQRARSVAEAALRRAGVRGWEGAVRVLALHADEDVRAWVERVQQLRGLLQGRHTWEGWRTRTRQALRDCGLWQRLQPELPGPEGADVPDAAWLQAQGPAQGDAQAFWPEGPSLVQALWLGEDAAPAPLEEPTRRWSLGEYSAWVQQVLESTSWREPYPAHEQVVLLPLSQMLARPFAAVVLAGCDEQRLAASPQPAGFWSRAQRAVLGLPEREALAQAQVQAWACARVNPWGDVLWRAHDDGGEPLLASALVLADTALQAAPEGVLLARTVAAQPTPMPQPRAPQWLPQRWSASAYEDLRSCPYRFFALRMLRLQSQDELDEDLDKRDFGTWLHAVLRAFHAQPVALEPQALRAALDAAAAQQRQALLGDDPEFLPFEAAWPAVREAYLQWWLAHAQAGHTVQATEQWREIAWPGGHLVGQLDRVDQAPDGAVWVLDYKTESLARTRERVADALEDTQMAFYGALVQGEDREGAQQGATVRGAYVNLAEGQCTLVEQVALDDAVQALRTGLEQDWQRLGAGAPLRALGEGAACEYCAARGLCRKDFWSGS